MQNKIVQTISQSKLVAPAEPADLTAYNQSSYERCWEVSLSYKTKFYLTEEEVKYYVQEIRHKKRLILVGGIILNNRPEYITKIKISKPLGFGETKIY